MKFQASVFRAAHACCPCFADARISDSNHEGGKTSMRNYTTQMDAARKGILTPELEIVAKKENMTTEALMKLVAEGKVAIRWKRSGSPFFRTEAPLSGRS